MENVDNIIIEHLRVIRADVAAIRDDVRDLKIRVNNLEHGQGTILQHIGHVETMLATQQASQDKLADRIERIERRLEIAPAQ